MSSAHGPRLNAGDAGVLQERGGERLVWYPWTSWLIPAEPSGNVSLKEFVKEMLAMPIRAKDIVPFNQARARLTELAEEASTGTEKIITRNGESYIALIDARRLDHYHRLEREHIHLTLLDEVARGLEDIEAGRLLTVAELRSKYGRQE